MCSMLVLSLAALLFTVPSAHAAFQGFNGKIALNGLNLVYPNGRGYIGLNPFGEDAEPNWSPDGTKLVAERFVDDETPPNGFIINADGSGVTFIDTRMADPAWAPDGARVVFRTLSFPNGIAVINANGTGRTVLVADQIGNWNINPAWSPDGQKIAFARCQPAGGSNCDIYTMNPDGTSLTNITNNGQGNARPSWSPDAGKIAFQRGSSPAGIWVMDANGGNPTQIGVGSSPAWSPDGQQVAYTLCTSSTCQLRRMNADGSNDRIVFPGASGPIDWQPCAVPCPPPPPPPYDTPLGSRSLRLALVPNFRQTISGTQCSARGGVASTHGSPLALPSCNPPGYVPGTVAHLRNDPNYGQSYATLATHFGDLAPGDTADIAMYGDISDVRTAAGTEYTQNVSVVTKLRITDSYNGSSLTDPGTVTDFDFSLPVSCLATPTSPAGGRCTYGTGASAVTPGLIQESKDTVVQVFRVRVNDSGADGVRGNADDRTFSTEGIFIP
jgi:hypothetical protein